MERKRIKVKAGKDTDGSDLVVSIPGSLTGRHYMLTGDMVIEVPVNSFIRRRLRKGELIEVGGTESPVKQRKAENAAKKADSAKKLEANTKFESKPVEKGEG